MFKPYAEVTTHIYVIDRNKKDLTAIPYIKILNDGFEKVTLVSQLKDRRFQLFLSFFKEAEEST